jgi:hypothetical protein
MWLDTKTYWLTDRQSQCNFDFEYDEIPRGGGVKYLHRSSASRRRRQMGSLESETIKYGRDSHGTRTREWMRWRGPAAILNDRPILSSERVLYKDYDRRCSIEKLFLAVTFKGLAAKTNLLAVNRQS